MSYNFTVKVVKRGQIVQRVQTHSKRRFLNKIRTVKWQNAYFKVYLRVSYGKGSYNDGEYKNENDFWLAFKAFQEGS